MTHPISRTEPSALERTLEVPTGQKTTLNFQSAADERGDWELRVLVNHKLLHLQLIDQKGERWKDVAVDLSPFAGQKISLRLENAANDWYYEFAYWSDIQIKTARLTANAQ